MSAERFFKELLHRMTQDMAHLNALDAAVGDGDHGTTMVRGLTKAAGAENGLRAKAFMRASGGASGTLFGLILLGIENQLEMGTPIAGELKNAATRICDLGEVGVGDKSMIDALVPAVDAAERGQDLSAVIAAAAEGRDSTRDLVARRGRAQYVEGGGVGHIDPGSVSVVMILETLRDTKVA